MEVGVIDDLGYRGRGRIWRGYEVKGMRGPLRVKGRNNKVGGGKGLKCWKPGINAPPSMRSRDVKLERKEGRMPRRV